MSELVVDLMGADGMLCGPYTEGHADEAEAQPRDAVLAFIGSQSATIAGGTTQIQMNILGERVLGLPREARADRSAAAGRG